ncbi:NlpC/P60 family protein [Aminobacter sp. BE82]
MPFQADSQNRSWLNRYVGAPFASRGRMLAGLDCWGLLRLIYAQELGIELPSYGEIAAHDLVRVSREITAGKDGEAWADVDRSELRAFDVVVMRYHGSRRIGHVGVAVDASTLIHVEEASAAVVVPLAHFTIRERIECFRRHRLLA